MQGRGPLQASKRNAFEKKVNGVGVVESVRQRGALRRDYRFSLEKDIAQLQKRLRQEVDTHKALQRAFRRTLGVLPRISPGLAPKVQKLLAEVAVLEEEVINLEECIVSLRQGLYNEAVYLSSFRQEKDSAANFEPLGIKLLPLQARHTGVKEKQSAVIGKLLPPAIEGETEESCAYTGRLTSLVRHNKKNNSNLAFTKPNLENAVESVCPQSSEWDSATPRAFFQCQNASVLDSDTNMDKENEQKIIAQSSKLSSHPAAETEDSLRNTPSLPKIKMGDVLEPNALSEEVVCCLSSILMKLARPSSILDCDTPSSMSYSTLSSAWSLTSKNSVSYERSRDSTGEVENLDPYGVCTYSTPRDWGPYMYYHQVSADSLDYTRIPRLSGLLQRLMGLVEKLSTVDLQGLTHQQKLAFWINIYNACMMHAVLEHGIPNNPHKVVALMGKAIINVGGHSLSALAIEHFILRLPSGLKNAEWKNKEKEIDGIMSSTYGLEWSEPLVSFALCCGSSSSPAVRIFTPVHVDSELETAKTEYLEATVGVTPTKVVIPKLLDWYMRDFAKDVGSLIDWISDQVPSCLSKSMEKCMGSRQSKAVSEVVEVMPYDFSFRYLFAVQPL